MKILGLLSVALISIVGCDSQSPQNEVAPTGLTTTKSMPAESSKQALQAQLAEQADPEKQQHLQSQQNSEEVEIDFNAYESAIEKDNTLKYLKQSCPKEFEKWQHHAQKNNPNAQVLLGECYHWGYGVVKDDVEAVKWYRKAAEQGNSQGQVELASMYQSGKGVTEDDDEAVKWFRKAAEQGNAEGQKYLGLMYQEGYGDINEDKAEAAKWFRKAAEQGNAWAQWRLGDMYEQGEGVIQNKTTAINWYRKAAEQDFYLAKVALQELDAARDTNESKVNDAENTKSSNLAEKCTTPEEIAAFNAGYSLGQAPSSYSQDVHACFIKGGAQRTLHNSYRALAR